MQDPNVFVKDADKLVSKWTLFNSSAIRNKELAIDLYKKAGTLYKIEKKYNESGKVYETAAKLGLDVKDTSIAAECYKLAATSFKNVSYDDSKRCYNLCIMYTESHFQIANIYVNIAELANTNGDKELSFKSYIEAERYFRATDNVSKADKMLLNTVDYLSEKESYDAIIDIYSKILPNVSEILASVAVGYIFRIISYMMAKGMSVIDVRNKIIEYSSAYPRFDNSTEKKFLENCLVAIDDGDVDAFTDCVYKHDRIYGFDNNLIAVYLRIKKSIGVSTVEEPDMVGSEPNLL